MARRVCSIVVVGEGPADIAFMSGFFDVVNIGNRQRQTRQNPRGKGSAFDFVRETLWREVEALQRYREGRGVVGMIDEDGQGVETRRSWVSEFKPAAALPDLDCAGGRCLLIPRRNLETWTYWLNGQRENAPFEVSEEENYKTRKPGPATRRLDSADFRAGGRHLATLDHTAPPVGMPPELRNALSSLRGFVSAVRR